MVNEFWQKAASPYCHRSRRRMDSSDLDPIWYVVSWSALKWHIDYNRLLHIPQQSLRVLFSGGGQPRNCPFLSGCLDFHLIHFSLGPPKSAPKCHLDQFTRFCIAHPYAQLHTDTHTHTHTHTLTTLRAASVATCRVYAMHAMLTKIIQVQTKLR